jgi:ribonucleoside-diphosphate reductase alpha chain
MTSSIKKIRKRTGELVDFNPDKITNAIYKAAQSVGGSDHKTAEKMTKQIVAVLEGIFKGTNYPTVEQIQDVVEKVLIEEGHAQTAKAYILYRNERAKLRDLRKTVPDKVKDLVTKSAKYFRGQLGEFVYYRTYSRWIKEEGRRETWIETIDRFMAFMRENLKDKLKEKEYAEIREAILHQETMPSMRLLQFAGPAARKTNVCSYNCSFIAPSKFEDFGEMMYILMCGTGAGFSVEYQNVESLPQIKHQTGEMLPEYVVEDSKEGWADALVFGMKTWFGGKDVHFNLSQIRPAGSRLETMGGRASGPEPLRELLELTRAKILSRQGRRLKTIDVHDIMCKIGEVVVAGGVRRSALISLSDLDDRDMRDAKMGTFYTHSPHRSMANNSAVYNEKPSLEDFLDEWMALMKSGTGERGIFNRGAMKNQLPERRLKVLGDNIHHLGVNPCGEIILQSRQFCNLSEIVARPDDTEQSLLKKARIATILGTYQATLTNFPYLSKDWKNHCETERLLGVSITGQWDSPMVRKPEMLKKIRAEVLKINKEFAKRFGINPATAATCVKPSGNTSQTVDSSSGLHPRYAPYYMRRIRISATDPLFHMLRDQKFPYYPEVGQTRENATTYVVEFPVKSPKGAICRNDITAIEQLEYWKNLKLNYTEHNPSATIYVGEEEWLEVGNWVYKNWDIVGGLSFLPRDNHVYTLAPYQEISKEEYEEVVKKFPKLDFSDLVIYEKVDQTEVKKELACAGGACEIHI